MQRWGKDWSTWRQVGGSENWDCSAWRAEGSGDLINKHLMGGSEEDEARLFSMVSSERQKGKESKGRKFHLKVKNCEGGQTLAQVPQRGCEVSVLGDTQNLTGHCPALGDSTWARRGWAGPSPDVPANPNYSVPLKRAAFSTHFTFTMHAKETKGKKCTNSSIEIPVLLLVLF